MSAEEGAEAAVRINFLSRAWIDLLLRIPRYVGVRGGGTIRESSSGRHRREGGAALASTSLRRVRVVSERLHRGGLWNDLEGSGIHVARRESVCPIDTEIWDGAETRAGRSNRAPVASPELRRIRASTLIENRRREVTIPAVATRRCS